MRYYIYIYTYKQCRIKKTNFLLKKFSTPKLWVPKKIHKLCKLLIIYILFFSPHIGLSSIKLLSVICVCVFVCVIFVVKKVKAAPSLMTESGPLPANRGLFTFAKASKAFSPHPTSFCVFCSFCDFSFLLLIFYWVV